MNFILSPRLSALAGSRSLYDAVGLCQRYCLGSVRTIDGPVANTGRYYRDAYQLAVDRRWRHQDRQ